jgi:hypothetical protein
VIPEPDLTSPSFTKWPFNAHFPPKQDSYYLNKTQGKLAPQKTSAWAGELDLYWELVSLAANNRADVSSLWCPPLSPQTLPETSVRAEKQIRRFGLGNILRPERRSDN